MITAIVNLFLIALAEFDLFDGLSSVANYIFIIVFFSFLFLSALFFVVGIWNIVLLILNNKKRL